MNVHDPYDKELRQIIAADQRCSIITPEDDQIWQLETSKGEPPGLAFQTTYGLRAYGIRIFPRFGLKKVPVSDPRAFASKPEIIFSAPNFLELQYSPYSSLDVNQKVWVPDSHSLVAQVNLTNPGAALIQLWMEWVVQLNPLLSGSPMTAAQISVNTVLQGQTGNLHPVFLLTGGPRGDLSAFPSLGIEVTLPPHTNRQFTWALATLNSTDESFYAARKATAYSLDNEQIKIEMLKKGQSVRFDFGDPVLNRRLEHSQSRVYQLFLPPFRKLEYPWYVSKRDPEHGNLPVETSSGYSANWGIQKITDIWALSRMLLPTRADLVKGMLQNLFDQQAVDGTFFAQLNWNGKVTNLSAAPLMAALAEDIYEWTGDREWLTQNYAAILRATKTWFQTENDNDRDGWPEWQHLIQIGLGEQLSTDLKNKFEVLIKTAEWPSLAALLLNEFRALKKIAGSINEDADLDWIEDQIKHLDQLLQQSWDQKRGAYAFRDQAGHFSEKGRILHTFKQNGSVETLNKLANPCRLVIRVKTHSVETRPLECKIKGVINHHEKTITFSSRDFRWEDENGLAISQETFSVVKSMSVSGLKKGESLIVETPDFFVQSPDFLIPLWVGVSSPKQEQALIDIGIKYFENRDQETPFYLKIMWLEALCQADRKALASQYFKRWYLGFSQESENDVPQPAKHAVDSLALAGLDQLIPLKTLLELLGVNRVSDEELILNGFNDFFPKVNVQYKKFLLDLKSGQARIENLNGESVVITEPGSHRIMLS
ncbi:MAG: hypothetical protein C0410_02825 [Anaerolinea sp.]|nr:hypothetical protein [Anaerolinea sp.]